MSNVQPPSEEQELSAFVAAMLTPLAGVATSIYRAVTELQEALAIAAGRDGRGAVTVSGRSMAEVLAARKTPRGCCERNADNMACDCVLKAHVHDSKRRWGTGPQDPIPPIQAPMTPMTWTEVVGGVEREHTTPQAEVVPAQDAPTLSSREGTGRVALFQSGDFTLNSGAKSTWKLECDALSPADWEGVAAMVMAGKLVPPFGTVSGVPRGGLPFAKALEPYQICSCGTLLKHHQLPHEFTPVDTHLLVDDVLTTGGSLEREVDRLLRIPARIGEVFGLVLFARGKCPGWVTPVLQLPEPLWLKK